MAAPSPPTSRVEVIAAYLSYPKDSISPGPATTMTTDELVAEFPLNAEGVIPASQG
jgi:hypothetical protein